VKLFLKYAERVEQNRGIQVRDAVIHLASKVEEAVKNSGAKLENG
jgi:hypothetical protein